MRWVLLGLLVAGYLLLGLLGIWCLKRARRNWLTYHQGRNKSLLYLMTDNQLGAMSYEWLLSSERWPLPVPSQGAPMSRERASAYAGLAQPCSVGQ